MIHQPSAGTQGQITDMAIHLKRLETIKKRLGVYHNQTAPLIEWYQKEGLHHHVKGFGELQEIFADIKQVIDGLAE